MLINAKLKIYIYIYIYIYILQIPSNMKLLINDFETKYNFYKITRELFIENIHRFKFITVFHAC